MRALLVLLVALAQPAAGAAAADTLPGRVRLALPPVIWAVPGIETNLYFDNAVLVLNPANYVFVASCPKGLQLAEKWTFTPAPEDVGDHPFQLEVRDESNSVLARARSTVRVARADAGAGADRTLLMIGASWTEASVYPEHVLVLSKTAGNPKLRLVGSRGPGNQPATGEVRHEGYSGWTAQAFITLAGPLARSGYHKRPETGSPFNYPGDDGKPRLDFARYCKEFNGGRAPDLVTIQLGPNDVFTATDETIEARIDTMFGYYDQLVAMIRGVGRETAIGIALTVPPASSQDGFRNYRGPGRQTWWQYRRNQHRVVERMIERYGGREKENVFLIPTYLNLDTAHNYPRFSTPWNSRTAESGSRVNNGTHPSPEGYRQMGDSIYCWLKGVLAAQDGTR
ncbi:MAG: hypothetical protein DMG07_09620 [Acidobacteria bacterium]|nr:MAG: hypothetical protein DMG07_09620 [Acidobacteriota bacterium]